MTYWKDLFGGFCESRMLGSYPEYLNAFSSFFIFLVGVLYLLLSNLEHLPMRITYAALSFNGIGSFLYHYYGYSFYGSLDTNPMFLVSWILVIYIWLSVISTGTNYYYNTARDFIVLFCVSFYLFSISKGPYSGFTGAMDNLDFLSLFIIPQIFTIVGIAAMAYFQREKIFHCRVYNNRLIIYSVTSIVLLILGVIAWTTTEPKCGEHKPAYNPLLLISHPFWHISFSYGFHLIFQVILYLTSGFQSVSSSGVLICPEFSNMEVRFLEYDMNKSKFLHVFLMFFPVVYTRIRPDLEMGS